MLNSLREWGERRSTRVFALKIAQKRLEFEGVCTVTSALYDFMIQAGIGFPKWGKCYILILICE
jgi:hypothetical protein